jgi:hypothetical protein
MNENTEESQASLDMGAPPPPEAMPAPDDKVLDVAPEAPALPAVSNRGKGALGEAWSPSPLALLSDEEFEGRLVLMQCELARIEKIKRAILTEDKEGGGNGDYGVIPGTKKPTLYQSGAEKFNKLAGLQPRYFRHRYEGDGETAPQFRYEVECQLVDMDGRVHGTGGGAANNFEKKFRYRNANLVCPVCGQETVFVSKRDPGWFCWRAKGGCGEQFGPGDQRIATQSSGVKENEDPHDLDNTVRQYADKRAYVKATRTTHALSNTFTQDIEDDPANAGRDADDRPERTERGNKKDRPKVTEGQAKMIGERAKERAKDFEGVCGADILHAVLGEERAAENVFQDELPETVKAISFWEPPVNAA